LVCLDASNWHRYDPGVPQPRAAEQPRAASDDTERERLIAAIEEGLADLDAGRSYSHAQVLAEMRELFPPSSPK
jgi:predicted transcriptional regulator